MADGDEGPLRRTFAPHPLRPAVLGEVHARPFHPLATPQRVLHFGFLTDAGQTGSARAALTDFCQARGIAPPREGSRHFRAEFGGTCLRWETHTEFSSYTWELPAGGAAPFTPPPDMASAAMAALPQPGPHLVSVDLHLLAADTTIDLEQFFDPASLTASIVEGGAAIVATDFRPDPSGFVRILVRDLGLGPTRAGALVQRLLEIETYRLLALLGLPEAQVAGQHVAGIEKRLAVVARRMTHDGGLEEDRRLLDELTGLSAELEAQSAAWAYRAGASRAYDGIVEQRLAGLDEQTFEGWPTIASFLSRRMGPAMQTVRALEVREADLAQKLMRAGDLLRTRVEVEIERQNRDLLRSMNERTRMQLRLQQTVEGLSVAAISYYIVGLAGYVLKGLKDAQLLPVDPSLATAAVVPLAIIGVALVVRRIRQAHHEG